MVTNGAVKTTDGKKTLLYRGHTATGSLSATQYLPTTVFAVGVDNGTPAIGDTDLDVPVPITNGTLNDDCNSAFTGTNGGTTSTNNTTTYSEGAGGSDATAQNLLTTGSNVNKTWNKTVDSNFTAARYAGFKLYIVDATALAKFKTAATSVTVRWRTDASNYYSKTWSTTLLAVGWNWLYTWPTLISGLTATGTPGTLSDFYINIETNAAGDAFIAGDVVIDVIRTWQTSDMTKAYVSGYPSIDLANLEVTVRGFLATTDANGFDINGFGEKNADATPLLQGEATITDESKTSLDEFAFVFKERLA